MVEYTDNIGACPECRALRPKHDDLNQYRWHQVAAIKARTVMRELVRRETAVTPYIGIDEKQLYSDHRYLCSLTELKGDQVFHVSEELSKVICQALITQAISKTQQTQVTVLTLDMRKADANAVTEKHPQATLTHARLHVSQHLNKTIDKVCRQENKRLIDQADGRLKGSKFFWLPHKENQTKESLDAFRKRKQSGLKVAHIRAIRHRLAVIKDKVLMIKPHLANLLTYVKHPISIAVTEELNSKGQTVKSNAQDYRSFNAPGNSILFYRAELNMTP